MGGDACDKCGALLNGPNSVSSFEKGTCARCHLSAKWAADHATCPIPNCGFPATHHVINGVFLCDHHKQRLEREVRATLDEAIKRTWESQHRGT